MGGTHRRASSLAVINLLFVFFWLKEASIPIVVSVGLSYLSAKRLSSQHRNIWLGFGILVVLAPLFLLRFPLETNHQLSALRNLWLNSSLAFFCLQSCGALLEIFWKRAPAPKSLFHWIAFSLFFPNLLSGPIARWKELGASLETPKPFTLEDGKSAALLMAQGLFKKMVFAGPFLFILDRYFANPTQFGWQMAIAMAFLLRYAIWAEIGSHTDWARAGARLLGYNLPVNFSYPFQTLRLAEFWRRWHSSLSSWLQDFVFSPLALGPLRRWLSSKAALIIALIVSFVCLGLWHGLTVTFFVMGLTKGLGVLLSEWSWNKFQLAGGWKFRFYKGLIAPTFIFLFLIIPTLLIRTDLASLSEIISRPDTGIVHGWRILTEVYDSEELINRSYLPYLIIGLAYELLLLVNRLRSRTMLDGSEAWDFFGLPPWAQGFLIVIGLVLFMFFADFAAPLGFSYARH